MLDPVSICLLLGAKLASSLRLRKCVQSSVARRRKCVGQMRREISSSFSKIAGVVHVCVLLCSNLIMSIGTH